MLLLLHADGPVLCCAVRWVIRVGAGAWGHDEMRLAGAQRRIMSMARVALRSVACQRRSMVPLLYVWGLELPGLRVGGTVARQ